MKVNVDILVVAVSEWEGHPVCSTLKMREALEVEEVDILRAEFGLTPDFKKVILVGEALGLGPMPMYLMTKSLLLMAVPNVTKAFKSSISAACMGMGTIILPAETL